MAIFSLEERKRRSKIMTATDAYRIIPGTSDNPNEYYDPLTVYVQKLYPEDESLFNDIGEIGDIGTDMELVIANRYRRAYSERVLLPKPGSLKHPRHEFIEASPDAEVIDNCVRAPVDWKFVSFGKRDRWGTNPPLNYLVQSLVQQSVRDDYGFGELGVQFDSIFKNPLQVWRMNRDEWREYENNVIKIMCDFRANFILAKREPPVSEWGNHVAYLAKKFPVATQPPRQATETEDEVILSYAVLKRLQKAFGNDSDLENHLKAELMRAVGDGTSLQSNIGRLDWTNRKQPPNAKAILDRAVAEGKLDRAFVDAVTAELTTQTRSMRLYEAKGFEIETASLLQFAQKILTEGETTSE